MLFGCTDLRSDPLEAYSGPPCVQQPQIILLKEGTDTSQGKAQLISNINACCAVVDAVRTTLGPRGMDKLIHDQKVVLESPDAYPSPTSTLLQI